MTNSNPIVLYLDQNAWIALAHAVKDPGGHPAVYTVLERLIAESKVNALLVPLSFTNIYETHKINDPVRREHLAKVQCILSQGNVFRGRAPILRRQLKDFLAKAHALAPPDMPARWFLSNLHFESVDDYDPERFKVNISETLLASMRANPAHALFHYLTRLDEETRKAAVQKYSKWAADLLVKLEARRARIAGESFDLRKRIYAVELLSDHVELIVRSGRELGLVFNSWAELGQDRVLTLPLEVPTFNIERELAVRIENERPAITENDLRDIAAFYTVLPYANILVAEKPFINRARQANLGKVYDVDLLTSLHELPQALTARQSRPAGGPPQV